MKNVMVVEDDPAALRYLSSALHDRGYAVRRAGSGHEALRMFEEECPDVIVSDLVMPAMDGNELLRQVRARAADCEVVFIMITGQPTVSKAITAVTEGADEVLIKPVDIDRLAALIGDPRKTKEGGAAWT